MQNNLKPAGPEDSFIFKGVCEKEYVLPSYLGKHMPYDPRRLPVQLKHTPIAVEAVEAALAFFEPEHSNECRCEVCRFWS